MSNTLEEKTTTEEEGEKEKEKHIKQEEEKPEKNEETQKKEDGNEKEEEKDDQNEEEIKEEEEEQEENEMKRRLRKNPKKTVLLYSQEDLNKYKRKKKKSELNDKDLKLMKSIIDKLKLNPKSFYFKYSALLQFDNKEDKDYYKSVIIHPMDFAHMIRKINNKKYNSLQEFYDDLCLIWNNAQTYNEPTCEVYEHAQYMRNYVEKVFKEKDLADKIIHHEKFVSQLVQVNNNIEEKEQIQQEEDNNKNDEKEKDNEVENTNENLEVKENNDEKSVSLIGKKRRKKKAKEKNKNLEKKEIINSDEDDHTPVIDIKKNDDAIESLEIKNPDNTNIKQKQPKTKYIASVNQIKKNKNNKKISNKTINDSLEDLKVLQENHINYDSKTLKSIDAINNLMIIDKDASKEKFSIKIENYEYEENKKNDKLCGDNSTSTTENHKENNKPALPDELKNSINKNNNNIQSPIETNLDQNNLINSNKSENIQKYLNDNFNQNNELSYNNEMNNTQNIMQQIGYKSDYQCRTEEILKKKEEEPWTEEKAKVYSHKIAKRLDKINDEDMFDLIEYIEKIRPQALVDNGLFINIDMTKFIKETYIHALNFIDNILFKNSIYT